MNSILSTTGLTDERANSIILARRGGGDHLKAWESHACRPVDCVPTRSNTQTMSEQHAAPMHSSSPVFLRADTQQNAMDLISRANRQAVTAVVAIVTVITLLVLVAA